MPLKDYFGLCYLGVENPEAELVGPLGHVLLPEHLQGVEVGAVAVIHKAGGQGRVVSLKKVVNDLHPQLRLQGGGKAVVEVAGRTGVPDDLQVDQGDSLVPPENPSFYKIFKKFC